MALSLVDIPLQFLTEKNSVRIDLGKVLTWNRGNAGSWSAVIDGPGPPFDKLFVKVIPEEAACDNLLRGLMGKVDTGIPPVFGTELVLIQSKPHVVLVQRSLAGTLPMNKLLPRRALLDKFFSAPSHCRRSVESLLKAAVLIEQYGHVYVDWCLDNLLVSPKHGVAFLIDIDSAVPIGSGRLSGVSESGWTFERKQFGKTPNVATSSLHRTGALCVCLALLRASAGHRRQQLQPGSHYVFSGQMLELLYDSLFRHDASGVARWLHVDTSDQRAMTHLENALQSSRLMLTGFRQNNSCRELIQSVDCFSRAALGDGQTIDVDRIIARSSRPAVPVLATVPSLVPSTSRAQRMLQPVPTPPPIQASPQGNKPVLVGDNPDRATPFEDARTWSRSIGDWVRSTFLSWFRK